MQLPPHEIIPAFPTPIYRSTWADGPQHNPALEREIDAMRERDLAAAANNPQLAAVYRWEEYTSFFTDQRIHRHGWFAPLKAAIEAHVQRFCEQLSIDLGQRRLTMLTSFANIMSEPFHHHGRHIHTGSVISGVYYIRAGEGAGQITFEHPAADHFMQDLTYSQPSLLTVPTISISPNAGELVLFPSHLPHKVEQSFTEAKRVAVSINMGLTD